MQWLFNDSRTGKGWNNRLYNYSLFEDVKKGKCFWKVRVLKVCMCVDNELSPIPEREREAPRLHFERREGKRKDGLERKKIARGERGFQSEEKSTFVLWPRYVEFVLEIGGGTRTQHHQHEEREWEGEREKEKERAERTCDFPLYWMKSWGRGVCTFYFLYSEFTLCK